MGVKVEGTLPEDPFDEDVGFGVWPENWETFLMFLRVSTQWNVGGMGGFLGLRYEGVWGVLDRYLRDKTTEERIEVFEDLQIMERAALEVLNEKKEPSK